MYNLWEEALPMLLSLSESEVSELRQALELHLSRLERELSRTEDRDYQRSLRATYDKLERVQHRLVQVLEAGEALA